MCRFLAYRGEPILMETLVTAPCHSLIHQSLHARLGHTETNGDGFGLGWYAERPEPGLYREVRPAWSDENLRSIAGQVRSPLFFAHVRSATGTATTRVNCHPFSHGKWLYMHNGQIGGWNKVRRQVESMIPDWLYEDRVGTTDSEAIFLAALADGLEHDPVAAMQRTFARVKKAMVLSGVEDPLRFTATLTDGETLWAFRWACDANPPSLYYCETPNGLVLVSEPIDEELLVWREVPRGCSLIARPGEKLKLSCVEMESIEAELKAA